VVFRQRLFIYPIEQAKDINALNGLIGYKTVKVLTSILLYRVSAGPLADVRVKKGLTGRSDAQQEGKAQALRRRKALFLGLALGVGMISTTVGGPVNRACSRMASFARRAVAFRSDSALELTGGKSIELHLGIHAMNVTSVIHPDKFTLFRYDQEPRAAEPRRPKAKSGFVRCGRNEDLIR